MFGNAFPRSTGIVIGPNIGPNEPDVALVLDLDVFLETGRAKIRKFSHKAFHAPLNMRFDQEMQKKYERLRDRKLVFGDHINWKKQNVDSSDEFIKKFKHCKPILSTRVTSGFGLVLLDGAINPAEPNKFYTKYFGNVDIPSALKYIGSPNVWLEAWIWCHFEDNIFKISLHSYNGICRPYKQMEVVRLPWNKDQGYSNEYVEDICPLAGDDDDSEGITVVARKSLNLEPEKKRGFCTGDGIFLLDDSLMTKCLYPIKKARTMVFGALYDLQCLWNCVERSYIVMDFTKSDDVSRFIPVYSPNCSLFAEVHAHPTLRDVYENKQFGLLDDPCGVLALFHLGQFASTRIPVTVSDRNPSQHGQMRFSISSIAHQDMDSTKILSADKETRVADVDGVVVENGVISAEHSPIIFHFGPKERRPPLGTHVTFDASYDKKKDVFNITDWHLNSSRTKLPVGKEAFSYPGSIPEQQIVYKVTVRLVTIKRDIEMLHCEEFGLIDDCLNRVVLEEKNNNYDVWIKASLLKEQYEYPARTAYHIVAVDDEIYAQEEEVANISVGDADVTLSQTADEHHSPSSVRLDQVGETPILGPHSPFYTPTDELSPSPLTNLLKNEDHQLTPICEPLSNHNTSTSSVVSEDFDSQIVANEVDDDIDTEALEKSRSEESSDIFKKLHELRTSLPHLNNCVNGICSDECPWLLGLAKLLVVEDKSLYQEIQKHEPDLAEAIRIIFRRF